MALQYAPVQCDIKYHRANGCKWVYKEPYSLITAMICLSLLSQKDRERFSRIITKRFSLLTLIYIYYGNS